MHTFWTRNAISINIFLEKCSKKHTGILGYLKKNLYMIWDKAYIGVCYLVREERKWDSSKWEQNTGIKEEHHKKS